MKNLQKRSAIYSERFEKSRTTFSYKPVLAATISRGRLLKKKKKEKLFKKNNTTRLKLCQVHFARSERVWAAAATMNAESKFLWHFSGKVFV